MNHEMCLSGAFLARAIRRIMIAIIDDYDSAGGQSALPRQLSHVSPPD
jgi:hypothetical protein